MAFSRRTSGVGVAFIFGLLLVGAGCNTSPVSKTSTPISEAPSVTSAVVLPIANYIAGRTFKAFGEYIEDRFRGYHVGDDVESRDLAADEPVYAIADGTVRFAGEASGYGGLVVITHDIAADKFGAIYGHLDLSDDLVHEGTRVTKGMQIAALGDDRSQETDGERKHLHFAIYDGDEVRKNGYEQTAVGVAQWLNPQDFFEVYSVDMTTSARQFDPKTERGGDKIKLSFEIPAGWEVEYIPSLEAFNLFTLAENGTARERSQMLIRYFDAAEFQTLRTVDIFSTTDLTVGEWEYMARRYDIQKKPGVPDFKDQPSWRNARHIVTDFRDKDGFTRYYVIAANPDLDPNVYESVLSGMRIVE